MGLLFYNIEQINNLLDKMRDGNVQIYPAPLEAQLVSYWHTLDPSKHPKCRNMLAEQQGDPAPAPFGVPRGTIVAWAPTYTDTQEQTGSEDERKLIPPRGWAICDGTLGTPDLRDRFVRGTDSYTKLKYAGGSPWHYHTGLVGIARDVKVMGKDNQMHDGDGWYVGDTNFRDNNMLPKVTGLGHKHTIHQADHLPPYTVLVYIMKL